MILEMVAWRDPNMVPIKAFYGDDLKVNYCGKLATDHHVQVCILLQLPIPTVQQLPGTEAAVVGGLIHPVAHFPAGAWHAMYSLHPSH